MSSLTWEGYVADWNPEYLYEKVFKGDREKMKWFSEYMCALKTGTWNKMLVVPSRKAPRFYSKNMLNTKVKSDCFSIAGKKCLRGEIKDTVLDFKGIK